MVSKAKPSARPRSLETSKTRVGNHWVIWINYGAPEKVFDSIRMATMQSAHESVVVDNYSNHENRTRLVDGLRSSEFEHVHLLPLETNLGFGAAVNAAVRELNLDKSSSILLLNPDAITHYGTILGLFEFVDSNRNAIVSPQITTGGPIRFKVWYQGGHFSSYTVRTKMYKRPRHVLQAKLPGFVSGACMALSTELFTELGGFDERFFLYWEDTDLCLRASYKGATTHCLEDLQCWHEVGGTSGMPHSGRSPSYFYFIQLSRIILMRKSQIPVRRIFTSGIAQTVRPFVQAILNKGARSESLRNSFRGIKDGLAQKN